MSRAAAFHTRTGHVRPAQGPALRRARRVAAGRGFTLVELLVAITLVAVFVVVVFPVVTQQLDRVQAVRAARDLDHLRSALRAFNANTLAHPLYLSHLSNPITTSDSAAAWHLPSPEYRPREVRRWNGPYIDAQLAEELRIDDAVRTGFDGMITNDLYCFDADENTTADCERGRFLAVRVDSLIGFEFEAVNDILDGEGEPETNVPGGSRRAGRLRFVGGEGIDYGMTVGVMFYLAVPYTGR